MTEPLYVSFYTPDEVYSTEARGLRASLDKFELDHHISETVDQGGWWRNTSYKSTFMCEMRHRNMDRPLVWLDADSRVLRRPLLFEGCIKTGIDVAVYYLRQDPEKLLSGTVFFNTTKRANKALGTWYDICQEHPEWLDQGCLLLAIEKTKRVKVLHLPIEYCYIFDKGKEIKPHADPVILHRQASRGIEDRKRVTKK